MYRQKLHVPSPLTTDFRLQIFTVVCASFVLVCAFIPVVCAQPVSELLNFQGGGAGDMLSPPTTSDFRVQIFTVVYTGFCFYSRRLCLTHFRDVKH